MIKRYIAIHKELFEEKDVDDILVLNKEDATEYLSQYVFSFPESSEADMPIPLTINAIDMDEEEFNKLNERDF